MLCSICLDTLQSPVVTPCGHVFCLDCLISSCQKSPDATKAPCPTCRTSFSLVSPNAMFVPEKYRQFIDSNIRRIFLDNSGEQALKGRVTQLEARVKSLETQKDLLMERCESYMAASVRHAESEREMRTRCTLLQDELRQTNRSVAEQINRDARRIVIKCTKQPVAIARKLDELDPAASPLSSPEALPNMRIGKRRGGNPNHAPLDADHRRIVPLPKRRRVTLVPDENR